MKSRYYVAAVTRVYRAALDAWRADPAGWQVDPLWLRELETVSHRPYGSGFLFGRDHAGVHPADSRYRQSHLFVGVVLDDGGADGWLVAGRNRFAVGDAAGTDRTGDASGDLPPRRCPQRGRVSRWR